MCWNAFADSRYSSRCGPSFQEFFFKLLLNWSLFLFCYLLLNIVVMLFNCLFLFRYLLLNVVVMLFNCLFLFRYLLFCYFLLNVVVLLFNCLFLFCSFLLNVVVLLFNCLLQLLSPNKCSLSCGILLDISISRHLNFICILYLKRHNEY